MLKKTLLLSLVLTLFLSPHTLTSAETPSKEQASRLGVWITVFSPEEVLYSKDNIDRLIKTCSEIGINDIYLQVYRSDKAYYDSSITDRTSFEKMLAKAGEDPITYLLDQASGNNIKIHAWVNLLSLAQNKDATVLKKLGESALTKDQHGNPSMNMDKEKSQKSLFILEDQLFLEPGDWRVRKYLSEIVDEILTKYPGFSGLHLDYVRYPATVPFIPGSRFTSNGISYGYNDLNIENFETSSSLDVNSMSPTRENFKMWDDWRRSMVTKLVGYISENARKVSPKIEISATIIPSLERTWLVTFQDWREWIDKKYVDYVIAMNYTDDVRFMELRSDALLSGKYRDKMYMGVGAYLLKKSPHALEDQITFLKRVSSPGIVIFSYDELAESKKLRDFLTKNFHS